MTCVYWQPIHTDTYLLPYYMLTGDTMAKTKKAKTATDPVPEPVQVQVPEEGTCDVGKASAALHVGAHHSVKLLKELQVEVGYMCCLMWLLILLQTLFP